MKRIIILSILFLIINCRGGDVKDIFQSLPKQILDWKAVEKDKIYDRETLYNYINGGAELYLAYDFKQVFIRRFLGPGENEIVLDIYDMGSSAEAFGIFSSGREDEDVGIGQGSEYGIGLLRFWKDRYFVSIVAVGDEQIAERPILELGMATANAIDHTGLEPVLLKYLPANGLIKNRISYFHSNISLNNVFFIASENILNLSNNTNCVFAEYRVSGEDNGYLLLIQYQNVVQAKEAYKLFLKNYMPEAMEAGFVQTENRKWTVAKTEQNFMTIVFEAPDRSWASELQSAIKLNER